MESIPSYENYVELVKSKARKMMYIRDPKEVEDFLNSPDALYIMKDNYIDWVSKIKQGRETPNSFGGAADSSAYCLDLMF